jgi:hypothetical protein
MPAIQGFLEFSGNIFDLFRVPQAIANRSAKNLAFTSVTIRSGVGYKPLPVGRALSSVLSRNDKLQKMFSERFGSQFSKVRDYYGAHRDAVQIGDVSAWLSELVEVLIVDEVEGDLVGSQSHRPS